MDTVTSNPLALRIVEDGLCMGFHCACAKLNTYSGDIYEKTKIIYVSCDDDKFKVHIEKIIKCCIHCNELCQPNDKDLVFPLKEGEDVISRIVNRLYGGVYKGNFVSMSLTNPNNKLDWGVVYKRDTYSQEMLKSLLKHLLNDIYLAAMMLKKIQVTE